MEEPKVKRAIAFFDGQNLYRHAMAAFGYNHPNYDPLKLFNAICKQEGIVNCGVRFYTGTPSQKRDPQWHGYWANRLLAMRRAGILVESREIRYREETLQDGSMHVTAQEKGIDIRIALDVVRLTLENRMDVPVIFSQDQDLSEVADEIRSIANIQKRWIRIISAFPAGHAASSGRGINKTDWIRIERELYDSCLDPRDYRPKKIK